MTTQTRRVYISLSSLRPESTFEVTRTDSEWGMMPSYTAELISGDVDCEELEDYEAEAIAQAREEWALEWAAQQRKAAS